MPDSTSQFFLISVASKYGLSWGTQIIPLASFVVLLVNVLKAEFTWMGGRRLYLAVPLVCVLGAFLSVDGLGRALVAGLLAGLSGILGWGTIRLFSPQSTSSGP